MAERRRRPVRAAGRRGPLARGAAGDVRAGRRRTPAAGFYGASDPLPHPLLAEARDALSAHYAEELGEPFTTAGLCHYRDGRDSVAWHGDRIGRGARQDTMVAILSVGAPRDLLLRPAGGRGGTVRRPLGHGDLIVMGGSCQRTWEHCVPKSTRAAGPRISVQFRPHGVR